MGEVFSDSEDTSNIDADSAIQSMDKDSSLDYLPNKLRFSSKFKNE